MFHILGFLYGDHEKRLGETCIVSQTRDEYVVSDWLKVFLKTCNIILYIPESCRKVYGIR